MLYDRALLLQVYVHAYLLSKKSVLLETAQSIAEHLVNGGLAHRDGGFYAGEGADGLPTADALEMKVCEFICHVNWRRRFLGMNKMGIRRYQDAEIAARYRNAKRMAMLTAL